MQRLSASIGLDLNASKCEIFQSASVGDLSALRAQLPGLKMLTSAKLELLGAPLATETIGASIRSKVNQLRTLCQRIKLIPAHQGFFLLKNCLCLPKLMYILRCSPTFASVSALDEFDDLVKTTVSALTNVDLNCSATCAVQMSLPVRHGGLGIRSAKDLAFPAYLASIHSSADLVSEITAGININAVAQNATVEWSASTGIQPPIGLSRKSQRCWDEPCTVKQLTSLIEASDAKGQPRLRAVSSPHAGSWLNALPVSTVGNLLDDDAVRIAVGLRLGAPICQKHDCRCGKSVDESGTHGLKCKFSAGRHSRHAALNGIFKRAMGSAGIISMLEPKDLLRDDGKRPDGKTLIPWSNGKPLVWDVTVVDTVADSYLVGSSRNAGAASELAEA